MSDTNTKTGNDSNGSSMTDFLNNNSLSHIMYNGPGGIPYAAIGMVTIAAGVFSYVTYADYKKEEEDNAAKLAEDEQSGSLFSSVFGQEADASTEEGENEEDEKEEEGEKEEEEGEKEEEEEEEEGEKEKEEEEEEGEKEEKEEEKEESPRKEEEPGEKFKMGGKRSKKKRNTKQKRTRKTKIYRKKRK
jgi:hypothetical protein